MAKQRLWGLTLLERNLRELVNLGIREAVVVTRPESNPAEYFHHPQPKSLTISLVSAKNSNPFESLRKALEENGQNVLALEANALNDRRILKKLTETKSSCGLISPNGLNKAGAAVLSSGEVALFNGESIENLTAAIEENLQNAKLQNLELSSFKTYVSNLRRDIVPFMILIENSFHLKNADDFLRQTVHKGTNDFVAKYIHPPFEFGIARYLAQTFITPNMVSFLNLLLSILAAYLFATGSLLAGGLVAAIKGILDGVDGKLSRLTLKFSKIGDLLDHGTDTIFDAIWYLALGWHFSNGDFSSVSATFTIILFSSYCVERIVPGIFKKLHGREIYDYAKIDRFMRLIGSRMNNNIWLLLIATILGWPKEGFYFISLWMLVTASWHTLRLLEVTWKSRTKEVYSDQY